MKTLEHRKNELLLELKECRNGVLQEMQKIDAHKPALGTLEQLKWFDQSLRNMIDSVENDNFPASKSKADGMWRVVLDNWPKKTVLGEKLVQAEYRFERFK